MDSVFVATTKTSLQSSESRPFARWEEHRQPPLMIVLGGLGSQIQWRRNTLTLNLTDTYNSGFGISRIHAAKNIPTQETPACQSARIQKPDEDPGRSARDRAAQDSRASQVNCLIRRWDSQKFGGSASPPNSAKRSPAAGERATGCWRSPPHRQMVSSPGLALPSLHAWAARSAGIQSSEG